MGGIPVVCIGNKLGDVLGALGGNRLWEGLSWVVDAGTSCRSARRGGEILGRDVPDYVGWQIGRFLGTKGNGRIARRGVSQDFV